jgi:hypothetical protein
VKTEPFPTLPIELAERVEKISLSFERQEDERTRLNALLAGVPNEQNRSRIIWHALVGFVNANPDDEITVLRFRAFTSLCCFRLDELTDNPMRDLRSFEDIEAKYDQTGRGLQDIFRSRVRALWQPVRTMLIWLARPTDCSLALRRYSLEFLLEHGSENAIQFSIDPTEEFDDEGRRDIPLFYWKRVFGYQTIFTPAAKFILDKLEQYHERTLTLDEAMPLILCKRAECGKLAVARRRTKNFCSDSCRTLYRQKTKPEAWAAYMRKYRSASY